MNIRILFFLLISLYTSQLFSQGKVTVVINNIKSDKGVCRTCLFNNESAFKGETGKPFQCLAIPVKNRIAEASFENIPAGNYAIMVFHDENNNNKMDKNFLGIPKEGYGASRNKLPFAAAPSYKDNVFTLRDKTVNHLNIRLRNL